MLFLKLSFQFCNHLIRHLYLVSLSLVILPLLAAQKQLQYINVISQAYPRIFILTFSYNEKGASSWNVLSSSSQFSVASTSDQAGKKGWTLKSLRQQKAEKLPKMDSSKGKQVPVRGISQPGAILTAHSTEVSQAQLFLRGFDFQTVGFLWNIHTCVFLVYKKGWVCVFVRATITLEETRSL